MGQQLIYADARLNAEKFFSRSTVLKLVPPPKNKTPEDLNQHIRAVVFRDRRAA